MRGDLLILFASSIYGWSYPIRKSAYGMGIGPIRLTAWVFGIAGICLLLLRPTLLKQLRGDVLRAGLVLGLVLGVGKILQECGLFYTTASKSAFLTAMGALLVPPLVYLIDGVKPRLTSILGLMISMMGVYFLIMPRGDSFNIGDLLVLIAATLMGTYITLVPRYSSRHPVLSLLMMQCLITSLLGALTALLIEPGVEMRDSRLPWMLLLIGLGCVLFPIWIQNRFQKETTATRAALIFITVPLFAMIAAWVMLGERFTALQWVGAGAILFGLVIGIAFPQLETGKNL